MNINYEYYKIFYYVAKYKNLTKAAGILHNNQPNISRTVKLLEHELGCNLIIRQSRGVALTPEGERLYSHIKIAVEQIQTAESEVMLSTGLQEGFITIGASETALRLLLPKLSRFKKMYPKIHIRIPNHLISQAVESVKNGLVDFAVAATPAWVEKPLNSFPIMEFKDILIGGPSYSFLTNAPVSLEELKEYPFVCHGRNTMTYQFYESIYHKHGLSLNPELEIATTDQILPIIKNDLGIGFIPEIYAKEALLKNEICQIPLSEELPRRQILFIENENYPLSVAAGELKKLLLSQGSSDLVQTEEMTDLHISSCQSRGEISNRLIR